MEAAGDAEPSDGEEAAGVDPLLVLPPEVVLKVCGLLPASDRARLGALSRGWRRLARDESLWRGVRLDLAALDEARQLERPAEARATLRVLLRASRLDHVHLGRPHGEELRARVADALARLEKVRSLSGVTGLPPLAVSHEALLLRAAPHLEALRVEEPTAGQLAAIGGMAALRRLDLRQPHPKSAREWWARANKGHAEGLPEQLEELEVLHISEAQMRSLLRMRRLRRLALRGAPPDRDVPFSPPPPPEHCRLESLVVQVNFLERPFVQSLVRAHAASLRELEVFCAAMDRVLYSHALVMPFDLYLPDLAARLGAVVRGAGLDPAASARETAATEQAALPSGRASEMMSDEPRKDHHQHHQHHGRGSSESAAAHHRRGALQRLVLRRDDAPHSRADHDGNSCSAQLQAVRDALAGSGVAVVCSACGHRDDPFAMRPRPSFANNLPHFFQG